MRLITTNIDPGSTLIRVFNPGTNRPVLVVTMTPTTPGRCHLYGMAGKYSRQARVLITQYLNERGIYHADYERLRGDYHPGDKRLTGPAWQHKTAHSRRSAPRPRGWWEVLAALAVAAILLLTIWRLA